MHSLCFLDNYSYRHTLRICNTDWFLTATMVTWTHLTITLCLVEPYLVLVGVLLLTTFSHQQYWLKNCSKRHNSKRHNALQQWEIPQEFFLHSNREKYSSIFGFTDNMINISYCQGRQKRREREIWPCYPQRFMVITQVK